MRQLLSRLVPRGYVPASRLRRNACGATAGAVCAILLAHGALNAASPRTATTAPKLSVQQIAQANFGADSAWFLQNIPFVEIDDPAIQRTYYYRWQLFRSHLRDLGREGWGVDEFLPPVTWARKPYEDLNDSSPYHIREGRWLRNPAYVRGLVDQLYSGGGNDRHFSESTAEAVLRWTEVTGDVQPALAHLDGARNLYWIEPLLDATEFTVASIDASGQGFAELPKDKNRGFSGGQAFRPSINAFQYGNALAVARFADAAGRPELAAEFRRRAQRLQAATLLQLWNPAFAHFSDVYQRSTATVKAGEFIRGRELVGLVPWQFELPPLQADAGAPRYAASWQHALSPRELGGPFGLRTVEPTYARYMAQYRYDAASGQRECQWNGPSWPFQSSAVLAGMANLLIDYPAATVAESGVTNADYVRLLRQYTRQHRLANGVYDLQEDYDPDTGLPIVGLARSHHYFHSTYNDLVLSGLLGIRPEPGDVLHLHPLLPDGGSKEAPIRYFAVQGLLYHGHEITAIYDADGTRYGRGKGLSVWADGRLLRSGAPLGDLRLPLPPQRSSAPVEDAPVNLSVNPWGHEPSRFQPDVPVATASSLGPEPPTLSSPAPVLYQPIDGREWFLPEIAHGWSPATAAPADGSDWYAVDLRHSQTVGSVQLAFFDDGKQSAVPASVRLQFRSGDADAWQDIEGAQATPAANTDTLLRFQPVRVQQLRAVLRRTGSLPERLVSFKVFGASR